MMPLRRLTKCLSLEHGGIHQGTSLFGVQLMILSNKGQFSPFKKIKADEMEMRKRRMVRITNRDREEEGRIMNPYSSAGIYVTASVEAQCRMITQNRKIKEEENIKNSKLNALKRAACMNLCATSFAKLVANLPNDIMAYKDPSTPLLQVLLRHHQGLISASWRKDG